MLDQYLANGRVHPVASEDATLDAVFTAWAAATANGQDALMMARSRTDVDRLNSRARDVARQHGTIHGPVIQIGNLGWQAGDLLRTRRNNRHLPLGDSHVRNGDRFRVLRPGVDGGLLVEDLTGRGRTTLPASYVTAHAEYGWASTIDGAQGATADLGLLLVRAGIDREHLYVGMTRGRYANHAYVALDPIDQDSHPVNPVRQPFTAEAARRLLADSLGRTGGQQAAHMVMNQARNAADESRVAPQRMHRRQSEDHPDRRKQLLQQYHDQCAAREDFQLDIMRLDGRLHTTEQQLHDLPRWRRGRRADLAAQLGHDREQLATARQHLADLDQELHTLKQELDTSLAQPESRPARTYKLMNQGPRVLPRPPTPNQRPRPTVHDAHQETGYGIDR